MDLNLIHNPLSSQELLGCLSKFVRGSASERGLSIREQIKSALLLLQALPATRHAVLQYIAEVFDDAISEHFGKIDAGLDNGADCVVTENSVIDDIQIILLNIIRNQPSAWAPLLSSWCLECLGDISSKYSERHTLPHSSSLNELLLVWMSCPPARSLIQIASECFASVSEAEAGISVDALIDASVRHSPHFDWIVAHIGSCYPQTIINRVLLCGLKDFFIHSQADTTVTLADQKLPKMNSVIGILSHLATQHSDYLRQAIWSLIQASLKEDAMPMEMTGPIYVLHLASASAALLHAATDVFLKHVTVEVLNNLTMQLITHPPPSARDAKSLWYPVVHLLYNNDHETVRILQVLLLYASNSSPDGSGGVDIHPAIQETSSIILNHLMLEVQRSSNSRCSDPTYEVALLRSLQSSNIIAELCHMLVTTKHGPSRLWLFRLLSCIALHCGEMSAVDVLCELLKSVDDASQLGVFVQIQQDIEAKHPDVLQLAISKALGLLIQSKSQCDDKFYGRVLSNLIQLCRWQTSRDTQYITRTSVIEALSSHMDRIASCLSSGCCDTASVLELLCMLEVPLRSDIASLIRMSYHLASCFFSSLYQHDTKTKFKTCQWSIEYLGRLCDSNSATQACILRLLLEGSLAKEFAILFGGKAPEPGIVGPTYYKLEKTESVLRSENQPSMSNTLRLMFHSGVIGHGLRSSHGDTALVSFSANSSEVIHNRQLLLEALWTCSCRRMSTKDSRTSRLPAVVDDLERKLSAEVAKHLAQMLVELVSPDVMYNDIPWTDLESVHVTVEHHLLIWRRFDENPVLWDIMDFLSTGVGAMKYCSCLLRSCTASLINQWESSREKFARNHPKLLATTCNVIEFMRKGQLLPEPLCYTGDILKHVSPYEVHLLLTNIWNYIKENAPLPGTRLVPGCSSRYTELIHSIIQNNIGALGHLCLLFFPPLTSTAVSSAAVSMSNDGTG